MGEVRGAYNILVGKPTFSKLFLAQHTISLFVTVNKNNKEFISMSLRIE
jgi:hypothetical protein